jgi:hypothetical protein
MSRTGFPQFSLGPRLRCVLNSFPSQALEVLDGLEAQPCKQNRFFVTLGLHQIDHFSARWFHHKHLLFLWVDSSFLERDGLSFLQFPSVGLQTLLREVACPHSTSSSLPPRPLVEDTNACLEALRLTLTCSYTNCLTSSL